jgi:hypothetical protein
MKFNTETVQELVTNAQETIAILSEDSTIVNRFIAKDINQVVSNVLFNVNQHKQYTLTDDEVLVLESYVDSYM